MKNVKKDSVVNYFQRFEFPGGITLHPLNHLDELIPLRKVNKQLGGQIKTPNGAKVAYESRREQKEINRMLHILEATSIHTQGIELITPSGKKFYPDIIAQLGDGTVVMVEVKHVLDFIWDDVIEKYQTMMSYCKTHGYGCALMDGKWRDFRFLQQGGTIHFPKVIDWFEKVIDRKGTFTLKDLRLHFKEEKYWPTLVSYCLVNGYHAHVSFRNPNWEINLKSSSSIMLR
jgi:hypothetical protein